MTMIIAVNHCCLSSLWQFYRGLTCRCTRSYLLPQEDTGLCAPLSVIFKAVIVLSSWGKKSLSFWKGQEGPWMLPAGRCCPMLPPLASPTHSLITTTQHLELDRQTRPPCLQTITWLQFIIGFWLCYCLSRDSFLATVHLTKMYKSHSFVKGTGNDQCWCCAHTHTHKQRGRKRGSCVWLHHENLKHPLQHLSK